MANKLFVRHSTDADKDSVFDFYNQNPHEFVFKRDPDVWKERIASGAVTLIHDDQGKILASAIAYPLMKQTPAGDEHTWTEIGSVRVAKAGIGLFDPLLSAHALRAYFLEPPKDRFVLDIVDGNTHSRHVFEKAGATLYTAMPQDLKDKVFANVLNPGKQVDWFQIGVEAMPKLAQKLLDVVNSPTVKDKKTGEEFELDFSRCILTTTFRKELEATAASNFGNVSLPDMSKELGMYKSKPSGP